MSPVKPAIVGAFVLSGILLGVGAIILLAGNHLFHREVHVVTYFEGSVAGLEVGAPVTFRGVRVGSVTNLGVNIDMKDLSVRIPVSLQLNPSAVSLGGKTDSDPRTTLSSLLKAGLQAQLDIQSLVTGQLRVNLDLRPHTHPTYFGGNADADEIPSSPSRIETLEAEIAGLPLKQIAHDADRTLVAVTRVAEQLGPRVGSVLDSLKQTSDAGLVTLVAARSAANDIDRLAVESKQQIVVDGGALKNVLESSDNTVRSADALLASVHEMVGPNSRTRDDLQAAVRDLAASASSLRTFSHEIERDPSDLVRRGRPP